MSFYDCYCDERPKQRSLNLYVAELPLDIEAHFAYTAIQLQLPPNTFTLVRARLWENYYDAPFFGLMVGYDVLDELGARQEVLVPYVDFKMEDVPWEKIVL